MSSTSGGVRAPADFVVTRHRITHPDEGPARIAEHTGLHTTTVSRVLRRLREDHVYTEEQRLARLRALSERPDPKEVGFDVPNPEQFLQALEERGVPFLLGGEDAAVHDGFALVPEHHLVYIEPTQWSKIASIVRAVVGKVAPSSASNLTVREMDPWLRADETGRFVERGQRLLDYDESTHVQLARSLEDVG